MSTAKKKRSLGTFGILLLVLLFVYAISWIANGQPYIGADDAGNAIDKVVEHATFGQLISAPINGFFKCW